MRRASRHRSVGIAPRRVVARRASACAPPAPSESVPPRATQPSPPPSPPAERHAPTAGGSPSGEPTTLAAGLAAPWSVVPLPGGRRAHLGARQRHGARAHRATARCARSASSRASSPAASRACTDSRSGRTTDGGDVALRVPRRRRRQPGRADAAARANPARSRLGEAEAVFTGIPRQRTHNGGRIAFGPDGMLYVTTGDAQIRDAAQDPDALGGKILRLTPEGDPAPGNPVRQRGVDARPSQRAGHRVDGRRRACGRASSARTPGTSSTTSSRGANYGWPVVEGEAGDDAVLDPVVVWPTSEASPSGIAAVGEHGVRDRTARRAAVGGRRQRRTRRRRATPRVGLDGQGRLRDVVAAPDGTLWMLTNNTDGRGTPRAEDDVLMRLPIAPAA